MKRGAKGCLVARALVTAALAFSVPDAHAAPPHPSNADTLISIAEGASATLAQRVRIEQQLRAQEHSLSPSQRWHLKRLAASNYLDEGSYAQALPLLQDVIQHSGDVALKIRASTDLINIFSVTHRYEKAFALVNQLTEELPTITDKQLRRNILAESSQMLAWVGQKDLAFKYAKMLEAELPVDDKCEAYHYEISAHSDKQWASTDPLFKKAIDSCLLNKHVVVANAVRLNLAYVLLEEGHADRSLSLLNSIAPDIAKAGYQPHRAWLQTDLAKAWLQLGNLAKAKQSALAALAAASRDDFSQQLLETYQTLYQMEKKAGDDGAALSWFEKYVKQNQAVVDDTKARALAYQMTQQEVVASKAKADALAKQNENLQLRQALASKAAETNRLYALLLLAAIALIVLWMFRLKYSQMRFRRLARHDGLTGAFTRQHFLDHAAQLLQQLRKAGTDACLVLLDLDYFKQINDTHGHAAGDEVLTHAVEICRRELRGSDVFGRLGGEEFGILIPTCSREQGIEIATRIRRTLAAAQIGLQSGVAVTVSASFGLACSSVSGYALQELLGVADAALYRAKNAGRNRLDAGNAVDDAPAETSRDLEDDTVA
jgi:diguanylate cyclase (GGDEF)-like protein